MPKFAHGGFGSPFHLSIHTGVMPSFAITCLAQAKSGKRAPT